MLRSCVLATVLLFTPALAAAAPPNNPDSTADAIVGPVADPIADPIARTGLVEFVDAEGQIHAVEFSNPTLTSGPRPPRGASMFGWGVFGVSFGVFNMALGAVLIPFDPGDGGFLGAIPLGFGAGFTILGALGVHYGKRRRVIYREWQLAHGEPPDWITRKQFPDAPPSGMALVVSGSVGLALAVSLLPNVIYEIDYQNNYTELGIAYLTVGSVAAFSGLAMIAVGGVQLQRRTRWHRQLRMHSLVPIGFRTSNSFGFGISGRF